MPKLIVSDEKARQKLFKGVKLLADTVTTTLGPKGKNVAIQRPFGSPISVHDGVTVAREVESSDLLVDVGVDLVKMAAQQTNDEAGDGTTTATLLAYELVRQGNALLDEGVNPMVLRQQIEAVMPDLKEHLKKLSRPVKSIKDIERVAYISSADEKIGELVAKAIDKVGKDGLVTVEEGDMETEVDYTEGMEFSRGYLNPYFATNPSRNEAVLHEPVIALVNRKISLNPEIVPMLEAAAKVSKEMLFVIGDLSGDAMATMVANKLKGNIIAVAVNPPKTGKEMEAYYGDLAILTGGKVVSDETGVDIQNEEWLGRAKKVVVSKDTTIIIGGKGSPKAIKERIESIRFEVKNEKNQYKREMVEERLARLSTGIGVIRVGAKTEVEMRERVERVKDAVGAATSAREEGIVAGGGTVFLQLSKIIEPKTEGAKLLKEVLESPARKLMKNSGETNDTINAFIQQIMSSEESVGYEVGSGEIKDLIKEGIIDPAKVVRLALENAISVATAILTTDAVIAHKLTEKEKERFG